MILLAVSTLVLVLVLVTRISARLRDAAARVTGRPFVLSARSALQASSADPVVEIRGMRARIELEDKVTASLRRGLQRRLPRLYDQARRSAEAPLRVHGEEAAAGALPTECPHRLADLLRHDWQPASRHGLAP